MTLCDVSAPYLPFRMCLSCSHAAVLVQVLELSSPHEVPAFHWLTGWLREDVLPVAPHEGAAQASQARAKPFLLCTRTQS